MIAARALFISGLLACVQTPLSATLYEIDLSPAGGIPLSLTNYGSNQDYGTGLSPLNESGFVVSLAFGGENGTGITFDDITSTLSVDISWTGLTVPLTAGHIHGPGRSNHEFSPPHMPNTAAGVLYGLVGLPIGTTSGTHTNSYVLTAGEVTWLFDNLLYINLHTSSFPGGEIRGQLIPVAVPKSTSFVLTGLGTIVMTIAVAVHRFCVPRGMAAGEM